MVLRMPGADARLCFWIMQTHFGFQNMHNVLKRVFQGDSVVLVTAGGGELHLPVLSQDLG